MKKQPRVYQWEENPLVFVLLACMAGVGFFRIYPPPVLFLALLSTGGLAAGILLLVWGKKSASGPHFRVFRTLAVFGLFVLFGLILARIQNRPVPRTDTVQAFRCTLLESAGLGENGSQRCRVRVHALCDSGKWYPTDVRALVRFSGTRTVFRPGQVFLVKAPLRRFETPSIPGQFDAKAFFERQGVYFQSFVAENTWKALPGQESLWLSSFAFWVRDRIEHQFLTHLPLESDAGMLSALLLGVRRKMDPELKAAYAQAGISHILAVSGMHVGLIFGVFSFLLGRIRYLPGGRILFALVLVLLLWLYAFVTGLSPSVLRAVTVFSVMQLNVLFRRPPLPLNSLCLATLMLLIWDVRLLEDVGYQLSFAAVYGILSFDPPIRQLFHIRNRILRWLWEATTLTVAATLATFPILVWYFHQFPVYFLLANLIAVPLSNAMIYGGIALLVVSPLDWAARGIGWLLHGAIVLLNGFVRWIESLPFASLGDLYLPPESLLFAIAALLLAQMALVHREKRVAFLAAFCFLAMAGLCAIRHREIRNQAGQHLVIRTRNDWMLAEVIGRGVRLNVLSDTSGGPARTFEEKALREGLHLIHSETRYCQARQQSEPGKRQPNRMWQVYGRRIFLLNRYPRGDPPPRPEEMEVLILGSAGAKTLARSLAFVSPAEIWVDADSARLLPFREVLDSVGYTGSLRNFHHNRFQPLFSDTLKRAPNNRGF